MTLTRPIIALCCGQALQRMQQRSWNSGASSSTTSCFGSPCMATVVAAGPALAEENRQQADGAIDAGHHRTASLAASLAVGLMDQGLASAAAPQQLSTASPTLQRVDSLEQLEASCRDVTGRTQQDTAAADSLETKRTYANIVAGRAAAEDSTYGRGSTALAEAQPEKLEPADGLQPSDQAGAARFEAADPDAAQYEQVPISGSRRGTDSSVAAENAWLRRELTHLRAEHVSTRVKCATTMLALLTCCIDSEACCLD